MYIIWTSRQESIMFYTAFYAVVLMVFMARGFALLLVDGRKEVELNAFLFFILYRFI